MAKVEISLEESREIDKAIRLLRDRHFRNHFNAKDTNSESAQLQRALAEELDTLRNRISSEVWEAVKK